MKIEVEKQWENKLQFAVFGISIAFANSLRRYASMRLPVLAIDKVTFYENSSSLFDEYLAHRIGLIPLTSPDKLPAETEVTFYLDEVGPKTVCSKDLKSSDKDVIAAKENIPIISINEKQKLKFEAKAKIGVGTIHAKYQAAVVSYEITEDKIIFAVESLFQMSPKEVIMRACTKIDNDLGEFAKELKKAAK